MNFFRRKNSVSIALDAADFSKQGPVLLSELLYAVENSQTAAIEIKLYDCDQLPLATLGVIAYFAQQVQRGHNALQLTAPAETLNALRRLNLHTIFSATKRA